MTNLIRFAGRKSEQASWWIPGRFRTKPSWYVGSPSLGVLAIETDVGTAEDWAWLTQQIHQLRAMYEARTGRELPERRPWWKDHPELLL